MKFAEGLKEGNREAAKRAFAELGEVAGHAIATALTLIDGVVVIGGGIAGASKYILPSPDERAEGRYRNDRRDTFSPTSDESL